VKAIGQQDPLGGPNMAEGLEIKEGRLNSTLGQCGEESSRRKNTSDLKAAIQSQT